MKSIAIGLSAVLFLSSCAAYRAQHASPGAARPAAASSASAEAPAAKNVMPDPKVVAAFQSQPLAVKQTLLISEIDKYIDELKQNGQYDCCVKPACRQCAITAGECHCRQVIDSNGPCCGECTQAWVEGRGNTAGVDREEVLAHLGCVRELYEKKVPEGVAAPGVRKDQE
jgi:hypothetical protein